MSKKKCKVKRKLKPQIIIFLIILLIITIVPAAIFMTTKISTFKNQPPIVKDTEKIPEETTAELINSILTYNIDTRIDTNFLEWFEKKYSKQILKAIDQKLKKQEYKTWIWHDLTTNSLLVLLEEYNKETNVNYDGSNVNFKGHTNSDTSISFVGDISLADNWYIMPQYDARNQKVYGILSEEIVQMMNDTHIMVANNEFTISDRGSKMPNKYYTFRALPHRLSIYHEMGVDLVTLANNHIYDFGINAFNDSLKYLHQYNIPYIGAGANIEEAKKPYYFIINGYKIGFVNATRAEKYILTPEATETTGGVLRCYDPTAFIQVIEETKKNSDYVVALVHWGKEDSTELEQPQLETSKLYIDAGADLIVGTHAHTLQGIDFYKDKAIIYNLGDFIFNNETKDTVIFELKINSDGEFQYYFHPCMEKDEYTYLLKDTEKERVLNKIRNLSPNIIMNNDGEFMAKTK